MFVVIDSHGFKQRREDFLTRLEGKAAIIPAASMVTHHADCEYPFRQDSDFWYLTGFDEPDAVALFLPFRPEGERYVLFVLPKKETEEIWNGFRWGVQGVVDQFGVDIAHSIYELPNLLSEYLQGSEGIVFRIGKHPKVESIVLKIWNEQLDKYQRNGNAALDLIAPCKFLHSMRLLKGDDEIDRIRQACQISAEAHELARDAVCPGMNERQIQGLIEQYFLEKGARGTAYNSIVAGGDNACVLHYTANNDLLHDGDLLLIDAGCSLVDYYNGDITRTFPINGKFTGEQKALYEIVLAAQEAGISSVKSGLSAEVVHLTSLKVLVEGLVQLGLLKGTVDSLIEQDSYRHLYMHRTGHWLGLDVHDVGAYRLGEYPMELQPGMILTVEPGIYVSDRLPVPEGQPEISDRWKGIGIRIEDDVLVCAKGPEVMSSFAMKSVNEMES